MRFAAVADIHGNAYALEAVLKDMDALGIDTAVNLGDIFSGPIAAGRTAKLLAERDFITIRGNHDRYLITEPPAAMGPSDRVAFDELSKRDLEWLASLPPTRTVFGDVFLCHAKPAEDNAYLLERVEPSGRVRPATLSEIERDLRGLRESLILCAHTHIPRVLRLPGGRTIVNPGNVGCPAYDDDLPVYHHMQTGTPNASYAVIARAGGAWDVTFRSIPYAWSKASEKATAFGRPDWAKALSTGWLKE